MTRYRYDIFCEFKDMIHYDDEDTPVNLLRSLIPRLRRLMSMKGKKITIKIELL